MSNHDNEFETAVAAATYAIKSQEEQNGPPLKTKNTRKDSMSKQTGIKISRQFMNKNTTEDVKQSGSSTTPLEEPAILKKKLLEEPGVGCKMPGKQMETSLPTKKNPTFFDKYLKNKGDSKDHCGQRWKQAPSRIKPATTFSRKGNRERKSNNYLQAWERAKKENIQMRHEKMLKDILEWENERKVIAELRKKRKESEFELRRARALQIYRYELSRIVRIAGQKRLLLEEQRRNEEAKVLQKAKKIQSTGKALNASD